MAVFEVGSQPPNLPSDPFFKLALTTKCIDGDPWDIANDLLDFLRVQRGCIGKVNEAKYTIRLDYFDENFAWCEVKIRLYALLHGCGVEFQRRRGCCVAFNTLYRTWAKAELDHAPVMQMPFNNKDVGLVLDMLQSPCKNIQCESLACFAKLLCDGELDAQDVSAAAVRIVEAMTRSSEIELNFPANEILKFW